MSLSRQQIDNHDKIRYRKFFWIWERDMLELAREYPEWRAQANQLGFNDGKIDSQWSHPDAGRHIKYMRNPWYNLTADQEEDIVR